MQMGNEREPVVGQELTTTGEFSSKSTRLQTTYLTWYKKITIESIERLEYKILLDVCFRRATTMTTTCPTNTPDSGLITPKYHGNK